MRIYRVGATAATTNGRGNQNEVAVATYFLIEVAAATSHNHAYRANSIMVAKQVHLPISNKYHNTKLMKQWFHRQKII